MKDWERGVLCLLGFLAVLAFQYIVGIAIS